MLDIRRAMGENTVAVIEGVRAKLADVERSLPSSVKVTVIRDDSRFIYASISSLEEHLIFGALFATIVVMFFIRNIRAVIISALAIPASIISSFTLMNIMGFTLNNMTLLGITLAVGIVIDDAIVVLEKFSGTSRRRTARRSRRRSRARARSRWRSWRRRCRWS